MKPLLFIMNDIAEFLGYGWRLRRVWWFTATARTRARFARTLLGGFWLGLSNLLSIAVLALVYGTVFKVTDFNSYVVYLGVGLVIWNSLAAAITSAPNLLEQNANHLQNTNLNPIFYSLEEWAFQFQTFLQSFLLVLFGLSFFQPTLLLHVLSSSWLPLINLIVFLFWAPLVICLLGARFRDLYQLVPIVLQLVFLLSPILYRKENLGPLSWTADINPIYRVLSPLRHSLLSGELLWNQIFVMALLNVLGIWLGCWLLKRERKYLPFMI
jgi:lipopolysaccharide transport system permease protein